MITTDDFEAQQIGSCEEVHKPIVPVQKTTEFATVRKYYNQLQKQQQR